MPISEYSSRLTFLKDSAHSLHSQSPSTAAHLLAVHNQILHDQFKPLNQRQKDEFCGACGSIRNSQSARSFHIQKKGIIRPSSKEVSDRCATGYKCLRCGRRTVKPSRKAPIGLNTPKTTAEIDSIPASQPSSPTSEASAPPQSGLQDAEQGKPGKTAENASSKKRAKVRKHGGLKALLASKQQSQPSLDLFDFLQ